MTEPEYALWREGNELTHGWLRADSPCRDCTPLFHADMVAGGMCDGMPGGDLVDNPLARTKSAPDTWRCQANRIPGAHP